MSEPTAETPWPTQWSQPSTMRAAAIVLFFVVFGCVGLAAGASVFSPGPVDSRAYFLGLGAPLLFGFAAVIFYTRLRVRGRSSASVHTHAVDGQPGLVIPYSRELARSYLVMCVTAFAVFGFVAVVTSIVVASDPDAIMVITMVACLGFTGYLGWTLAEMGQKRLLRGHVVLTQQGVWHRSWAFESYQPWDDTASVSPGDMEGQLITLARVTNSQPHIVRRSRLWKQPEYKLAPHTAIKGMYLAVNPALALNALRFYHENPAARAELGTEAGVRRVRTGAV